MNKILLCALVLLAFVQCKKDKPEDNSPSPSKPAIPFENNIKRFGALPDDANGAVFSIRSVLFQKHSTTDSIAIVGPYLAWFGNPTVTDSVGVLTCNDTTLELRNTFTNQRYQWYKAITGPMTGYGDTTEWVMESKGSFGNFKLRDDRAYPVVYNIDYPVNLSLGEAFTLKFTTSSAQDVNVVITDGQGHEVLREAEPGENTLGFTASELRPLVQESDYIQISIVPVIRRLETKNGKNIYMVKENFVNLSVKVD